MTAGRRALGARGEGLAARWYEAHGYVVLARNWRCREGEIDLVLARGRQVVVCEVKTRTSTAYGTPAEAVTRTKQLRIRRVAMRWLDEQEVRPSGLRFDVACVMGSAVDVIEAAF
ncbi:MAG TPA: YraN family protein [Acidimicrobiales bacterium]